MKRFLAFLSLAVPILAWGLSFPSIKAALTEFPPMTLAFGRFVLAALVLGFASAVRGPQARFTRKDRRALVLSVLSGITLYFLFENHGVKLVPASAASLIIAGIPILTLLAEAVVSRRQLGRRGIGAALVSFAGAALLVGFPGGSRAAGDPWGYALMFGAALSWVLYLFAMKPLQQGHDNLKVTAWQMILGAVFFLPFALSESADWRWPSLVGWGHLAFQGLICSASAYLLYNYALRKLGMRTAGLAVNLIPVVTAVASYFLLGELLGPWQWLGGTLVLGAVVAVALKGPEAPRLEGGLAPSPD